MPTPNDPRRERIATAADFNERCAMAFGYKNIHAGRYNFGCLVGNRVNAKGNLVRQELIPDFANSPKWCWKAHQDITDAGYELCKDDGEYCFNVTSDGGETWKTTPWNEDLGKATMLAFCEMKEADALIEELDKEDGE